MNHSTALFAYIIVKLIIFIIVCYMTHFVILSCTDTHIHALREFH